jgi:hypothetical protein
VQSKSILYQAEGRDDRIITVAITKRLRPMLVAELHRRLDDSIRGTGVLFKNLDGAVYWRGVATGNSAQNLRLAQVVATACFESKADHVLRLAAELSPTMRAAVRCGIGGAYFRTLDALERRGLIEDAPERPGYYKLSELGESVRAILRERA